MTTEGVAEAVFGKAFFGKGAAMNSREYFERTATTLAGLGREELKNQIKNFKGRFKLDFTEDYLNKLSIDRLRHVLLAAMLTARPGN